MSGQNSALLECNLAFWADSISPERTWFLQVQSQMQRDFEIKLVLIFHSKKKREKQNRIFQIWMSKKATKSLISIKLRRALVVFGLFSTEICF